MKKILLSLMLISIVSGNLPAQKTGKSYMKMKDLKEFLFFPGNDSFAPYYMSSKPVTNREYITYLLWLSQVYERTPLTYYNAIPGLKREALGIKWNSEELELINLNAVKAKTESFVKDYMFNAAYIDYPVIGLTWEQAGAFCRWLSDRYNEYLLLEEKTNRYDPDQKSQNCFTTEAYLAGQYEAIILKPYVDPVTKIERLLLWEDKKLFPSFRLPASHEIPADKKMIPTELKPYPMFSFLKTWYGSDFKEDRLNNYLNEFQNTYENPLKLASNPDIPVPANTGEWYLDSGIGSSPSSVTEIYKQLDQKELDPKNLQVKIDSTGYPYFEKNQFQKDPTGQMPFLLIGETANGQPVIVENFVNKSITSYTTENSGKIFRVAVSAIKIK